ncbi:MAG: hypothetical protein ACOZAO_01495 [Patescibacteria group bacterium]
MLKQMTILGITLAYVFFIYKFVNIYNADRAYVTSKELLTKGYIDKSIEEAQNAQKLNKNEPRYYQAEAKALLAKTVEETNKDELKQTAVNKLETAIKLNDKNLATIRNNVPIYYFVGVKDLAKEASINNLDADNLTKVNEYYAYAENYAPQDVGVKVLLAKYYKKLFQYEKFEKTKEDIKALRPDLLEWHEDIR